MDHQDQVRLSGANGHQDQAEVQVHQDKLVRAEHHRSSGADGLQDVW
jgi:hypothetical protein